MPEELIYMTPETEQLIRDLVDKVAKLEANQPLLSTTPPITQGQPRYVCRTIHNPPTNPTPSIPAASTVGGKWQLGRMPCHIYRVDWATDINSLERALVQITEPDGSPWVKHVYNLQDEVLPYTYYPVSPTVSGPWLVEAGGGAGTDLLIPANFVHTGGLQGTATVTAKFTYTVTDARDGTTVLNGGNVETGALHRWKRPTGHIVPADFGFVWMDPTVANGLGRVVWCNEQPAFAVRTPDA